MNCYLPEHRFVHGDQVGQVGQVDQEGHVLLKVQEDQAFQLDQYGPGDRPHPWDPRVQGHQADQMDLEGQGVLCLQESP